MAKVGAQRAAELTGKSKSTIQRAMSSGKLSFELDNNGRRVIDVSELERCFGLKNSSNSDSATSGEASSDGGGLSLNVQAELDKAQNLLETERLKMRIQMLEDQLETANGQIEELKAQRDQWQKQASQVLITSQYSQKQAEDLAEQLKERERKARVRREQIQKQRLAQKSGLPQHDNENHARSGGVGFDFNGLWKKVKGH